MRRRSGAEVQTEWQPCGERSFVGRRAERNYVVCPQRVAAAAQCEGDGRLARMGKPAEGDRTVSSCDDGARMKRLPPENDLHGDRKGHAEVGVEHHALVDIQGRGCNDHMRTTPEMKDRAFRHEDPKLTPYSRAEGNWSACGIFD